MKFPNKNDHKFNFEDCFFRDLTACLLDTIDGQLTWVNRFSNKNVEVRVPIFYSMTGDENFLLNSFSDDIVSDSRYIELNTSMIPRGHITLTSISIKSDEFANPNVWLKWLREDTEEIRRELTKIRAIPLSVKYDLQILVKSEIDSFKCQEAIMNILWLYKYMYFEHNFMNIDAIFVVPDDQTVEINREVNLSSDNTIKLTTSFEVHTYYPAVRPEAYNYKTGKLNSGGGKDGVSSDNVPDIQALNDGNMLIPKQVRWRNHTNRAILNTQAEQPFDSGTYVVEKSGEIVLIVENVNNSSFNITRTYKLKDSIPISNILRIANQFEIEDFILSINSNFSLLNASSTSLANTMLNIEVPIVHYVAGTVTPIDYTVGITASYPFWNISSFSVGDYYNVNLNLTASNANLIINDIDSTHTEYIGGYNIYNQQYLIQFGINQV